MSSYEIQVLTVDPVSREESFQISSRKVTGISKLVQIVVLSLLSVEGKDALDPGKGGGLPSLISSNIDPNDSTEIFAEIARRVRKTEQEILEDQLGSADTADEKLREIQIVGVEKGASDDVIFVRLRVINERGQVFDAVV